MSIIYWSMTEDAMREAPLAAAVTFAAKMTRARVRGKVRQYVELGIPGDDRAMFRKNAPKGWDGKLLGVALTKDWQDLPYSPVRVEC